jgi:hypothetical protein
MVYSMGMEDPGSISFAGIGGLSDQIRELREVKTTMSSRYCRRKGLTETRYCTRTREEEGALTITHSIILYSSIGH